jgi:hypothetical protein
VYLSAHNEDLHETGKGDILPEPEPKPPPEPEPEPEPEPGPSP